LKKYEGKCEDFKIIKVHPLFFTKIPFGISAKRKKKPKENSILTLSLKILL
jgi:hypothetical protein